jgi:formyl-CoA transferase
MLGTPQLRGLVDEMVAAMRAAPGVGLAAPQIGAGLQVIVVEDNDERMAHLTEAERAERGRVGLPLTAIVNPVLRRIGDAEETFFEGCLSVPGYAAMVPRALEVEVEGLTPEGAPLKLRATGWPARILQHECDHLAGTLYLDRMHSRTFTTVEKAQPARRQALQGLRVVELGSLIAGPFAARILADFGADVIKVEPPGAGDPLRNWRMLHQGTSLWWAAQARSKRSVTVDLRHPDGQQIVRELARGADLVVENFRPGALEKWNLGYEDLARDNPGLILVRLSGYGQTGPYRDRVGFGAIGEAMGGLRYLTGHPDRLPARTGVSLGDSLASLYGVIGALTALRERDANGGKGQVVDVALYEAVFSLLESTLPEYSMTGFVRERSGSTLPGIAPSNTYLCKDGAYVVIGGNGDAIFKRLMRAIGRDDLAADPALADNAGRAARADELDAAIGAWTAQRTLDDVLAAVHAAHVPAARIYSIADIVGDAHYQSRGMIEKARLAGGEEVLLPGIVPKLSETPGRTRWIGPRLGEHTAQVLAELGYDEKRQRELRDKGVIG